MSFGMFTKQNIGQKVAVLIHLTGGKKKESDPYTTNLHETQIIVVNTLVITYRNNKDKQANY